MSLKLSLPSILLILGTLAPAAQALPYCYMQGTNGQLINLEDMCSVTNAPEPVAVVSPVTPTPGALPGALPGAAADQAPEIAPPTAEVAKRKIEGGNTRVTLLVRFARNAPDDATATATVTTTAGQSQSVSVSRNNGRVQNPEVVLRGNVNGDAIDVSVR